MKKKLTWIQLAYNLFIATIYPLILESQKKIKK